ncbi:MAG: antitoxin component YwqK of YwqJK toxin-antitoxin module [Flammeovirgaceae bacterium]
MLEDSFFWATDTILRFDKGGLYMLTAYEYRQAGNYKAFYNFTKMLELGTEYLDTLTLPKSTVWFESELHTGYANRFESELYAKKAKWHCCEELCQGEIVEYYSTGEKRLEGKFKDGLPMGKIIYYDKKGNIGKIAKYRKGYLRNIIYPNLQAWLNITEDSKL